ncbi:hypothetical protein VNO77_10637 [Canavalia gladiata]|uniref:Uncharacterized protein n=1 Tax=Canavalia gladiata TaxID=3824 RepID=A0AAN9MB49_CANGL
MAWFCAAISSGVPLVFVNIQTEQTPSMEKPYFSKRETACRQKFHNTAQIIQGIRLWFLPGLAEISTVLIPGPGEVRFGMEIKQTDEVRNTNNTPQSSPREIFVAAKSLVLNDWCRVVCIYSVMTGSSADRAGIKELYEEAIANGFLMVISRLQGKSVMPTRACSAGLVHCCDQSEIKDILTSAMDQYEAIQLHLMAWPNQTHLSPSHGAAFAALLPPKTSSPDS